MNVYIGQPIVVSDMQGPAPIGYHVPLQSEWLGVKTIMDGLSLSTPGNWRVNLHLPFAGRISGYSGSISEQGESGRYWCSSDSTASNQAYRLYFYGTANIQVTSDFKYGGYSIRAFKNTYEAPDSSWTVIQGTLGSAGIFWNQSEGLISITDGTTGYTIMDKNVGATTVYSDGNTLSEYNCGKYYQRGNNYGFAFTGPTTTSTTSVDASGYGPLNYYNSSTFIYGVNGGNWDSSDNSNLRGGVSQGTSTVSQELKNAYIGEYTNS